MTPSMPPPQPPAGAGAAEDPNAVRRTPGGKGGGGFVWAAAALGLQVVVILAFSLFYLVELARGESTEVTRVLMSVVVFVVGAAGLAVLARALLRRAGWARTPTVLWNVFLVLIAVSMFQSQQPLMATALLAVSLVCIGGVALGGRGGSGES